MVVEILILAVVSAYCAIVLLGHVLLLIAVWRGRFPKLAATETGAASSAHPARQLGLPGGRLAA